MAPESWPIESGVATTLSQLRRSANSILDLARTGRKKSRQRGGNSRVRLFVLSPFHPRKSRRQQANRFFDGFPAAAYSPSAGIGGNKPDYAGYFALSANGPGSPKRTNALFKFSTRARRHSLSLYADSKTRGLELKAVPT